MAKSPNQKLKLLYLYQILLQRTDEEHPITVPQLIGELDLRGIRAERKSVYDDLEALRLFGLDVQSRKGRPTNQPGDEERRPDPQAGGAGQQPPGPPAPAAGVRQRPGQGHEREHIL